MQPRARAPDAGVLGARAGPAAFCRIAVAAVVYVVLLNRGVFRSLSVTHNRWLLGASFALALVSSAYLGFATWERRHQPQPIELVAPADCDLGRTLCRALLPAGGTLEVDLSPRPVTALRPLELSVALAGFEAETVEVSLDSPDMYMGRYRQRLAQVADGHGTRFGGRALLPACTLASMRWRLTVEARRGRTVYTVAFVFSATRPALQPGAPEKTV
jgi:hypothetical protein